MFGKSFENASVDRNAVQNMLFLYFVWIHVDVAQI